MFENFHLIAPHYDHFRQVWDAVELMIWVVGAGLVLATCVDRGP